MSKYARFPKDLFTNKRKFEEVSMVTLSKGCSIILQNKLPAKNKDLGSFTTPCMIGSLVIEKALSNLCASFNFIPYTIFRKLGLRDLQPAMMTLQLGDRSIRHHKGIIKYVLVKVDKFIFLMDFGFT